MEEKDKEKVRIALKEFMDVVEECEEKDEDVFMGKAMFDLQVMYKLRLRQLSDDKLLRKIIERVKEIIVKEFYFEFEREDVDDLTGTVFLTFNNENGEFTITID